VGGVDNEGEGGLKRGVISRRTVVVGAEKRKEHGNDVTRNNEANKQTRDRLAKSKKKMTQRSVRWGPHNEKKKLSTGPSPSNTDKVQRPKVRGRGEVPRKNPENPGGHHKTGEVELINSHWGGGRSSKILKVQVKKESRRLI